MSFVDKVVVDVMAGPGGGGRASFRREKYVEHGGPDGGDGGNGGDVVLVASQSQNTLARFRYQKRLKAEAGCGGGKSHKHGKNGQDLLVPVPVGTVALTEAGETLADLTRASQRVVIAAGGRGGFGNAHFVSSTRQAPNFAEKGEPGQQLTLTLELKMIADVGLVGLPNAGKSTLLASTSNARPEIADYPFTTLTPNLGVVDLDPDFSILIADIPGLIEGAAAGRGLGHDFLRHIERTAALVHLVDAYAPDVAAAYKIVRKELKAHQARLVQRPEIIALNKVDGLDGEIVGDLLRQLKKAAPRGAKIYSISARSGQGIKQLLWALKDVVAQARALSQAKEDKNDAAVLVLKLSETGEEWTIEKRKGSYTIRGPKIERFAARTDFDNGQAVARLRDIMRKMGIMHELKRRGIEAGQTIQIGDAPPFRY